MAVGKLLTKERIHKKLMYRVLRSLWYTKDWVKFVEVDVGTFLIKFGTVEDRERIMNLTRWMFDQHILSLVQYEKGKEVSSYNFQMVPFWIIDSNIPIEMMDGNLALKVGTAMGRMLAIDWKDRKGGWVQYMRIRVREDTSKSLRRVERVEGEREEFTCVVKYERLPIFCYLCGCIGHFTKNCNSYSLSTNLADLQFR